MIRKELIQDALAIVRQIEEEVQHCCFPAYDADTLNKHPDINARYRECVNHVVAVYCARAKEEVTPELKGLLTAMQLNRTGPP